jgi:Mg-chelatase subunit ChlD
MATNMLSFVCTPEFAVIAAGEEQMTLNLRIRAPLLAQEDESKRSVVSLSAVLDKSGSMAGSKLALVKHTCHFMLGQLGPNDKMGVVEYDSDVNELIPLSKTTELFQQQAAQVINSMRDGSRTNLSGGLFKGIAQQQADMYINWDDLTSQAKLVGGDTDSASWVLVDDASSVSSASSLSSLVQHLDVANLDAATDCCTSAGTSKPLQQAVVGNTAAMWAKGLKGSSSRQFKGSRSRQFFGGMAPPPAKSLEKDAVRSIFLFTDGIANVGLCDEALVTATKKLLDFNTSVRIFTFGFGSDHSEKLLSEIAAAGSGQYYYIASEENIALAFADALGGLLSVAAQNVTLDFMPSEGVVIEQIHTPLKTTQIAGGCQVNCGDLLSEESKDVLLDIRLPSIVGVLGVDHFEFKIGTLKVSYFDVGSTSLKV